MAVPTLKHFITRKEYEEMGSEYLKEHYCSNGYFPTPVSEDPQSNGVEDD